MPGREAMPASIKPMLATLAPLPPEWEDARYGYEIKWDGVRAVVYVEGGAVRIETRNGKDATRRYPELAALGATLGATACVLDGEVVAFDDAGRPSFEKLQRRMHVEDEFAVRRLMADVPIVFMLFDVLWLDGLSTLTLPYTERRRLLDGLALNGSWWQTPAYHVGDGAALLEASRERGLEGVVAKRLDSLYEAGRRSRCWLKVKNHLSQEFVVGGWLPGEGNRSGRIGALLIGYYETDGTGGRVLRYAGRAGTGFTEAELDRLAGLFAPIEQSESSFTPPPPLKQARFITPAYVAQVEFGEWTAAGIVRHPVYKGLRDDKDPRDVVREL